MNIAFIPVRGGSKAIPLKNIKNFCSRPLVYWTAKAASQAQCIDKVVIATDNAEIKNAVISFNLPKIEVFDRKAENAADTASTESVMLEYLEKAACADSDNFFLIQATSPLLTNGDICAMFEKMQKEKADSALSCVRVKRFFWNENGEPLNYDYTARPRRQEFKGTLMENGACYINKVSNILRDKNRLSGKICLYEMPEYTAVELDSPADWETAEKLMRLHILPKSEIKYKMFLVDCDGTLTDGGMFYIVDGKETKRFNAKDGMAFELLRNKGVITGIITGETSDTVKRRAEKIKADELHMGIRNKLPVVKGLSEKYNIPLEEIVYAGDDLNDLEVIKAVGMGCSVADGQPAVKQAAKYISPLKGGDGAVRDIANKIWEL